MQYFFEQGFAFVEKGDVVIGISTSGNSINVIKGLEKAREKKAITVGFTGQKENKIENRNDRNRMERNNHQEF